MQRLHVATIWDNDECTYFAYGRGVFSIDPASIGCWVNGQADAQFFDDQAQQDFDEVRAEFAAGSDSLDFGAVWYESDSTIKEGSYFQFDRCMTYVYWPRYTGPGDIDEDAVFIPIDENWYGISLCG